MENDFVIVLNDMPIDCNKQFIQSNFHQFYMSNNNKKLIQQDEKQFIIEIDGGNDFYDLTKNILQGRNCEINNDNISFLGKLSKILKNSDLQTKVNLFCYQQECEEHQIDQHPLIQSLIDLSSLVHQLTLSNYEECSDEIKQKFIPSDKYQSSKQKKGAKPKNKRRKKRKQESDEENENIMDEGTKLRLTNINKTVISKLFYYEIVKCLSSSFHSIDELQDHQNKIDIIIRLINELDSSCANDDYDDESEDDVDEDDKSKTYLKNFIKYVIKKYNKIKTRSIDFQRETFYLINYLLTHELLTVKELNNLKEDDIDSQDFFFPDYFLHFYPQKMLKKYFKNNLELIIDENTKDYYKFITNKKESRRDDDTFDSKIKNYLQEHQNKIETCCCFDDDFLKIFINDDLNEFKSYLKSKVEEKINYNKRLNIKGQVTEDTIINNFTIPPEISKFSCISSLTNCSLISLAAFFGSIEIFRYLNNKIINNEIYKSSNLLSYLITGQSSKIIKLYLDSMDSSDQKSTEKVDNNDDENDNKSIDDDDGVVNNGSSVNNSSNNSSETNSDTENDTNENEDDDENNDDDNDAVYNASPMNNNELVNVINEMKQHCINFCNLDLYDFINNYLQQFKKNDDDLKANCNQLDIFMKKCVSRGYFEIIPSLLKEGATADVLLNLFCKADNEIGIEYMLEFSYIDVNAPYNFKTPLEYCIYNKNSGTSLLLLNSSKIDLKSVKFLSNNKNKCNDPLIFTICRLGLSQIVGCFLKKKLFDIGLKTSEGLRLIHFACQSGDFDTVSQIVEIKKQRINVNVKVTKGNYKGFTAFHFACLSGNPKIVDLLLDRYEIDINQKTAEGWTPLQYAVSEGHTEVVSILLELPQIETNIMTDKDETLLHLACMSNKEKIVDMLINNPDLSTKFDLNAKTNDGRTPFQIALLKGNYDMIELLLNRSSSINSTSSKRKSKKNQSSTIDINTPLNDGKLPIFVACEMRRIDIFHLLLKQDKIDLNVQLPTGKSLLYIACQLNLTEIITELLSWKDIDVNAPTKFGKTPLFIACEKGNREAIELLIEYNKGSNRKSKNSKKQKSNLVDFNAKTNEGKTAIMIACEYFRMDIVEMLLQIEGINCDDPLSNYKTPLCYGCEKSNENLVSALINYGANVNYIMPDNKTPLYFACLSQNLNIVEQILTRIDKKMINLQNNSNGKSPLFIACENGNLDLFNMLINEINADDDLNYTDSNGRTLLYVAMISKNFEIIKALLVQYKVDPNIADNSGKKPFHIACEMKNVDVVDLFINQSPSTIDINEQYKEMTPIEIACNRGDFETVQLLLKQEGIIVNQSSKYDIPPLLCACEKWKPDIIKLLLKEVPDIDVNVSQSDGRRLLHYACEKGDPEICEIVLSRSAESVDVRTSDKRMPIEFACMSGNADVIILLLKYTSEIRIHAKFYDGNTILTKACLLQSFDIVKYLIENTIIDINATNSDNKSALYITAENGNEQICQLLLNHEKIDINMETNHKTPLYEACKRGNVGVVELLIKKGAKVDCLTKNGKTPLHVACQHGFNRIVSLLLNCPEVDVNLLTVSQNRYKTFYSPLHLAVLGENHRPSYRYRSYSYSSNNNNNNKNDGSKQSHGNYQLCIELLIHHPRININLQTSNNETALTIACNNQDFDIITALLQSPQIDPNTHGSGGNTALHFACQNRKISLIQALINNPNTDVNCTNSSDQTPLTISCEKSDNEMVKLLLKREDLIVFNSSNENPIRIAIRNKNTELFTILLNHPSFNINGYDINKVTPLCYAIESQHINLVRQLLLISNTDVNKKSLTTNLNLGDNDYSWRYYSSNKRQPNGYLTPLNIALRLNNYEIVKMLIQSPYLDINEYASGKTALHASIICNNYKIFSLLLSSPQIDINLVTKYDGSIVKDDSYLCGQNALHIAVQEKKIEMIKELLRHRDLLINEPTSSTTQSNLYVNKYRNNCNALYIACSENQPEIVQLLLQRDDIDVNSKNTSQQLTPLHIAAKKGYLDIVNILLSDERCDPKTTSSDGTDILIFACQSRNEELLRMILSNDPESLFLSKTNDGDTALHVSCRCNDINILNILLKEIQNPSFDINVRNKKGETPLHIASQNEIPQHLYRESTYNSYLNKRTYHYKDDYKTQTVFGRLISCGADINACNLYGQTPLHYACYKLNYINIEVLLKQKNIKVNGDEELGDLKATPFITLITTYINSNYKTRSLYSYGRMSISNDLNETINNFIHHGANYKFITEDGVSFIHFALMCSDYEFYNFFINHIEKNEFKDFINLYSKYGTPIKIAVDNWNNNIMRSLLNRKKEIIFPNDIKESIIYVCVKNNDEKSLLLLLLKDDEDENNPNLDFDVNYVGENQETPLHVSIDRSSYIMINILSNYEKTELNVLNKKGKSALHKACCSNEYSVLAMLTKVDIKNIKKMFDMDNKFDDTVFSQFLISQVSSLSTLNQRIDINIKTEGITRKEFFRIERNKEMLKNPQTTKFHIHYHEPEFNIGYTALHICCANRYLNAVRKILNYKSIDINEAAGNGDTAVSLVAKNWDEDIALLLLDYPGVNLNCVPKSEESDDEYDDEGNHIDKNEEQIVDPNRTPHTLTSEEMQEIKQKKMNQNKTFLHAACANYSYEIINKILDLCKENAFDINGVDSFDGMAPLHYICHDGQNKILDLFVKFEQENPNIINWNIKNKNGMTPLHFAARKRQRYVVDTLINNKIVCPHVDINAVATGEFEMGRTPISFACEKGYLPVVCLLLDDDDDDEYKDLDSENDANEEEDQNPFSFASDTSKDKEKQLKEELEKEKQEARNIRGSLCGAKNVCDLSIKAKCAHQRGMSPLHYACCGTSVKVVKLILKHGGCKNINIRANGKSCLFLACENNRPNIVRFLLEQENIDYNIKTPRGITPLMIASQEGRYEIVEILLNLHNIDTKALSVDGESAESMAKNYQIRSLFNRYT